MARVKSWKNESALVDMIKLHIKEEPYRTSATWNQDELDDVVEAWESFFSAIAGTGMKLSKLVLLSALKKYFRSDPKVLLNFSNKLVLAEQYCRSKCKGFVNGSNLNPSVKNVVKVMLKAKPNKEKEGVNAKSSQELSDSSSVEEVAKDMDICAISDDEAVATDAQGSVNAGLQALQQLFEPDLAHKTLVEQPKTVESDPEVSEIITVADSPPRQMAPQASEPAVPLHKAWGNLPCLMALGKRSLPFWALGKGPGLLGDRSKDIYIYICVCGFPKERALIARLLHPKEMLHMARPLSVFTGRL